jgi:hypothetical protein
MPNQWPSPRNTRVRVVTRQSCLCSTNADTTCCQAVGLTSRRLIIADVVREQLSSGFWKANDRQ